MVKAEYYIAVSGREQWDEVDHYIYTNWEKVVNKDGTQRYNGARIMKVGNDIHGYLGISLHSFGILARMIGATINSETKGYLNKPEFVRIKERGKVKPYEIGSHDSQVDSQAAA